MKLVTFNRSLASSNPVLKGSRRFTPRCQPCACAWLKACWDLSHQRMTYGRYFPRLPAFWAVVFCIR